MEKAMTGPRDLLLENNPFFVSAVANPWDQFPDIESINSDTYQAIMHLIGKVHQKPENAVAALVLGEAGSGKTHLLGRILRSSKNYEAPFVFVYIKPILNPDSPMRHLLRGIVTDLSKEYFENRNFSAFDLFIVQMLIEYLSSNNGKSDETLNMIREDPYHFLTNNNLSKIDRETIIRTIDFVEVQTGIPKKHLKIIFQLATNENRRVAISWLRGDILDDDECTALSVPSRENKTEVALEEEAHNIIISLGKLVRYCNHVMLVCFDQLENLETDAQIHSFGTMVETLINRTDAILPITFIRADKWNGRFNRDKPNLDIALIERLEHNKFILSGCSPLQADELIRQRIQFYFKDQWEGPYNWLKNEVNGKIHEGYSPRQVITLANIAINGQRDGGLEPYPCDILSKQFQNECDLVAAKLDNWPADTDQLLFSLENFLRHQPYAHDIKKTPRDKINLRGTITNREKNYNYAFIINTIEHHKSIGACLQRGIDFMQNPGTEKCVFITDPRCVITKNSWRTTNSKFELFKKKGGRILHLEKKEAIRWYAFTSLLLKITEGDISYPDNRGSTRRFTNDELSSFIRTESKFGISLILFPPIDPVLPMQPLPVLPPNDAALLDDITAHLMKSPMRLLSINNLLDRLNAAGYTLIKEELLEFCGSNDETFQIFVQKVGSMIMLREAS